MKIAYTEIEYLPDLGLLKNIELAGRVCYKSEQNITEDSAAQFVSMIKNVRHNSVLEHGSVYFKSEKKLKNFKELPWCHIKKQKGEYYYYTNLRYVVETDPMLADCIIKNAPLPKEISYFTPAINDPYARWSFRIITNFKISEQYVRHRVMSHSKESSRWCNYSKERFGNETTIIIPRKYGDIFANAKGHIDYVDDLWYFYPNPTTSTKALDMLKSHYKQDKTGAFIINVFELSNRCHKILYKGFQAERDYMEDIFNKNRPEDARDFLSLYTKTEQVISGFYKDFQDVIAKRMVIAAQEDARFIANQIQICMNGIRGLELNPPSSFKNLNVATWI